MTTAVLSGACPNGAMAARRGAPGPERRDPPPRTAYHRQMANRSRLTLTDDLVAYVHRHGVREHPVLAGLRERTAPLPESNMQIGPEQGAFMALLVRLIGARRILEIGTFTGYSSTAMALALPPDGRITCLDVSREWTDIARQAWTDAGVADRVELRLGPATESLAALGDDAFDLAFVDADKPAYSDYYDAIVPRLRPGGLLLADNTLWSGRVADPDDRSTSTEAIRAYNARAAADDRVDTVILPVGDGITLSRKR